MGVVPVQLGEDRHRGTLFGGSVSGGRIVAFLMVSLLLVGAAGFGAFRALDSKQLVVSPAVENAGGRAPGSGERDLESRVVVDIDGAVKNPGVYRLDPESRVGDAIDAAGGVLEGADVSSINRASRIVDGQKVFIPLGSDAASAPGSGAAPVAVDSPAGLVSINTADAAALDGLDGIGPATAAAIVEDRDANGPFTSLEDLMRVSGIGEKKFAALKDQICL